MSKEAIERHMYVYEEDLSPAFPKTRNYQMTHLNNVDGDIKYGIGYTATKEGLGGSGTATYETYMVTTQATYDYRPEDEHLGDLILYFYDPIIERKNGTKYIERTYNTGIVSIGIGIR